MKRPSREHLRPVKNPGITEKRFKRLFRRTNQVGMVAHASVVLADLRRGSLSSLDRYLAKNKGIPDRKIALELRKLISGTSARSHYRLVVVEHPGAPKDFGGRPPVDKTAPSDRDRQIASRYEELLATEGKAYLAVEMAVHAFGLSKSTIIRAIQKVKHAEREFAERVKMAAVKQIQSDATIQRRSAALEKLRTGRKKGRE
ncbi:MAG: hypothetical protein V4523_11835 [Pseudomonadota bacterium]